MGDIRRCSECKSLVLDDPFKGECSECRAKRSLMVVNVELLTLRLLERITDAVERLEDR